MIKKAATSVLALLLALTGAGAMADSAAPEIVLPASVPVEASAQIANLLAPEISQFSMFSLSMFRKVSSPCWSSASHLLAPSSTMLESEMVLLPVAPDCEVTALFSTPP